MIKKKDNKKILESKRLIKEAQETIRLEKINIKKSKKEEFKKTKFYKFLKRTFKFINFEKDTYSFPEVLFVTTLSLLVGALACFSIITIITGGRSYLKMPKEMTKFLEVYNIVTENYNGDLDKGSLIDEAINGMLSSVGDKYTTYFNSENTDEFNEFVTGVYEGIGCSITAFENKIKVVEVFEDGPAAKAGLLPNDLITFVDDKDVSEMTTSEVSNYIKTKEDATVEVTLLRGEEELTLKIVRGKVDTPVIGSKIYTKNGKKVGYLSISMFSSSSAKQFSDKLKKLEDEGIDGLVMDVRGNNGGYLTSVTTILNKFLSKGTVLYQTESNKKTIKTYDDTKELRTYPVAVLVNGSSASASEILAGAIKESYSGFVVGTKTYGKGTVQQTKILSDGTMLKYTIENWLTPDGNWINDVGVEPTHEIKLDDTYYKNPTEVNDKQLQKALELVSK